MVQAFARRHQHIGVFLSGQKLAFLKTFGGKVCLSTIRLKALIGLG